MIMARAFGVVKTNSCPIVKDFDSFIGRCGHHAEDCEAIGTNINDATRLRNGRRRWICNTDGKEGKHTTQKDNPDEYTSAWQGRTLQSWSRDIHASSWIECCVTTLTRTPFWDIEETTLRA